MNGQISIFDFPEYLPEEKIPNKVVPEECKQCVDIGKIYDSNGKYEIDIYHCGIDGHPTKSESGRPGTKCIKNHICKHSGHTCNKEELWKVANTLDGITCNRVCCRNCDVRLCGARCNGSKEPLQPLLNRTECDHDHRTLCNRYGPNNVQLNKAKADLPQGFSCSGCCYYCLEAPMHGGKCKWDCRYYKEKE